MKKLLPLFTLCVASLSATAQARQEGKHGSSFDHREALPPPSRQGYIQAERYVPTPPHRFVESVMSELEGCRPSRLEFLIQGYVSQHAHDTAPKAHPLKAQAEIRQNLQVLFDSQIRKKIAAEGVLADDVDYWAGLGRFLGPATPSDAAGN